MTKVQAIDLQANWKKQVHSVPCDHMNQELENTASGYLTGIYYCVSAVNLLSILIPFIS